VITGSSFSSVSSAGSITASSGTLTVAGISSSAVITGSSFSSVSSVGSITASSGTLTVAGISSSAVITGSSFSSVSSVGSITASSGTLTVAGISSSAAITVSAYVYAEAFRSPSDRRLKANIEPLDVRAKDIFRLNGVSFNYKRRRLLVDGSNFKGGASTRRNGQAYGAISVDGVVDLNTTHFGFIAQEVEVDFPELVGRSADGTRNVEYSSFVPLLVEGMKSQRAELTELRRRVNMLSPAWNPTLKSVSVKGLSSTGAVTAHHDLARLSGADLAPAAAADVSHTHTHEKSSSFTYSNEGKGHAEEFESLGGADAFEFLRAEINEVRRRAERIEKVAEEREKIAEERAKVAEERAEERAKVAEERVQRMATEMQELRERAEASNERAAGVEALLKRLLANGGASEIEFR